MNVPHEWIVNHMRVASKLAMTIEAYALQNKHEVFALLDKLGDQEWMRFARIACVDRAEPNYVPSPETRVMVRELVRDDMQVLCGACTLTQAVRKDRVEAIEGNELCLRCWTCTYVLDEQQAPTTPLPANVTPLRRIQKIGKLGPWRAREPSLTKNKE